MLSSADSKQSPSEILINEFLVNDDVNRRQEILAELRSTLSQPTMAQSLDSLIERLKTLKTNPARISSLLGSLYRIKEDFNSALPYIDAAIALGDPNAMFLKGFIHMHGLGNLPLDKVKAMEYYRAASNLNHRAASNNLAVLFSQGPINGTDYSSECHDLFFKAAELGCPVARAAFNDMEKRSICMHYSFFRDKPVSVLPSSNKTDILSKQSFQATIGLGIGEGCDTAVDSVSVEHACWLPAGFSQLDIQMQAQFLKLFIPMLENIYFAHTINYLSIFRDEPFKAEQEKIKFTNNRHMLIQNKVEAFSKEYFEHKHTVSSPRLG